MGKRKNQHGKRKTGCSPVGLLLLCGLLFYAIYNNGQKPTPTEKTAVREPFSVVSTSTRAPTPEIYFVNSTSNSINVRSCPETSCEVTGGLVYAAQVEVIGRTDGESVNGNRQWYQVRNDGETGYVHSALLSLNRPPRRATAEPNQPAQSVQQSAPAEPPRAPSYACDCSKTCPMMASCEEAYFQLQCGCGIRDRDNDGVPCENICPGG